MSIINLITSTRTIAVMSSQDLSLSSKATISQLTNWLNVILSSRTGAWPLRLTASIKQNKTSLIARKNFPQCLAASLLRVFSLTPISFKVLPVLTSQSTKKELHGKVTSIISSKISQTVHLSMELLRIGMKFSGLTWPMVRYISY